MLKVEMSLLCAPLVCQTMQRKMNRLLSRLETWALRESAKVTHKGVVICDVNFDDTDDSDFLTRTKDALDMIEQKDPRRFLRVQREIRYIVNKELNSGGRYRRNTKSCLVDFGRYPFGTHPDWYLCCYAGLIVHEATHGTLYSKGLPYTPENREQIERICHAEEYRFMRRAMPQWREHLANEYDPSRWHFSWHASKWARLRGLLNRIIASLRKTNKQGHGRPASSAPCRALP